MLFTKHHLAVAFHNAVTDVRQISATYTNGMHLGDVFSNGTKCRHRTERCALEVHVKSGHHYTLSLVGKGIADIDNAGIKELRLVNTHHIGFRGQQQDSLTAGNRSGDNGIAIVAHHLGLAVTDVDFGFEDFYTLTGNARTTNTSDEFFGLSGKHAATNHFDAATLGIDFCIVHNQIFFNGGRQRCFIPCRTPI